MIERLVKLVGLLAGYGAMQLLIRAIDQVEWPDDTEPAEEAA